MWLVRPVIVSSDWLDASAVHSTSPSSPLPLTDAQNPQKNLCGGICPWRLFNQRHAPACRNVYPFASPNADIPSSCRAASIPLSTVLLGEAARPLSREGPPHPSSPSTEDRHTIHYIDR